MAKKMNAFGAIHLDFIHPFYFAFILVGDRSWQFIDSFI